MIPEKVKKIAVVRANVLGDFIFILPALNALKKRFPEAELVYLGQEWHKDFMNGRPGPIDRVEIIPKTKGMPHESDIPDNPEAVELFFQRMQKENFDIAFQMHGGEANSNPFTKKLGAKLSIGLRTPNARPLDINIPYILFQPEVLRYLEVAAAVGAYTYNYNPSLCTIKNDSDELSKLLPDLQYPYVVIHPGASDPRRRWSSEKFSFIADKLIEGGHSVYITGVQKEADVVEKVLSDMKNEAIPLINTLNLKALTAFLAKASLLVSNDTGPLHLARALSIPTVGIYWCSNMVLSGPMSSSLNRSCIDWNNCCPNCGTDCTKIDPQKSEGTCKHEVSFVNGVSTNEVLTQIYDLLESKNLGKEKLVEVINHR